MTDNIIKKLVELEKKAEQFGFYWPNAANIMEQIHSEFLEVQELLDQPGSSPERLQEEIGDLLHAVFSLCVFCGFDPENTLAQSIDKFEKRFAKTKFFAQVAGNQTLHGKTIEEMMVFWNKAKETTE